MIAQDLDIGIFLLFVEGARADKPRWNLVIVWGILILQTIWSQLTSMFVWYVCVCNFPEKKAQELKKISPIHTMLDMISWSGDENAPF